MDIFDFLRTEKVFTILELNNLLRDIVRREFPEYIWVCGEVQDLSIRKKHIYFNLVQKHPEVDEIIAQAKGIIFENSKDVIFKRLENNGKGFELKNDIEIKVMCKVDFYPKFGQYRLIVVDIDPIYTLGKIAQNRQKIIEALAKKGLLNKNKQLKLPELPLNIGLITSACSAAYHDFISELKHSRFGFRVYLFDSHMQGKNVEREIIEGINFFCRNFSKEELDLIVITRGGGSSVDLGWFDNQKIAERVATVPFPVVSALGHEINTTITDLVAYKYFKTPTKVAQFLVETVKECVATLDVLADSIVGEVKEYLKRQKGLLESYANRMESLATYYFSYHKEFLTETKTAVFGWVEKILGDQKVSLHNIWHLLKMHVFSSIKYEYDRLGNLEDKMNILNPLNVLKRGYSITMKGEKVVKSVDSIVQGEELKTILFDGEVNSTVNNVKKRRDDGKKRD